MPNHPNFLLGYGERLVEPIEPIKSGAEKPPPYSFTDAKARLTPMLQQVNTQLAQLPATACPRDEAVAVITLHPQYIAKSYYPGKLLASVGLDAVGSRPALVKPEKWTRKAEPEPVPSTDLFVAGPRARFRQWAQSVSRWVEQTPGAEDIFKVELLRAMTTQDRIRPASSRDPEIVFEVVLHASALPGSSFILEGFEAHLQSLGLRADFDRRFYVGNLCFLPLKAPRPLVQQVAQFSFLRVIRQMPRLRTLRPIRSLGSSSFPCALPKPTVMDEQVKVAVFDGGLDAQSPLLPWTKAIDPPKIGPAISGYQRHGHEVTSALLFGPVEKNQALEIPYAKVDHYRVLDVDSETDPYELYDVLARIRVVGYFAEALEPLGFRTSRKA